MAPVGCGELLQDEEHFQVSLSWVTLGKFCVVSFNPFRKMLKFFVIMFCPSMQIPQKSLEYTRILPLDSGVYC